MYVLDGECFSMNNVIVTEPAQYSIFIRSGSVQNLSYNNRKKISRAYWSRAMVNKIFEYGSLQWIF